MNDGHDESRPIHHARATSRGGKLLIEEPPLQILPSLAVAIGLNEAIFLQQLHYWVRMSSHVHDGRRWVYNSLADWRQQFPFWSDRTLRRVIKSLESPLPGYGRALLVSTLQLNTHPMDKTKWYTLDYDLVDELSAPTDGVEAARGARRCGQTGRIEPSGQFPRCGQSGHIEGPWRVSPSGQNGRIERSDWPAPSGQNGHIEGPEWPAPHGQSGRFSLQRLPETTDKTPTPCARADETAEGETASGAEASAPVARSLTAADGSSTVVATPCVVARHPGDALEQQAVRLVQAFHQRFHGGMALTPHRAELAHARALLQQQGPAFARFFLRYAQRTARHEGRAVQVFGGIMRYEASALAAYRRQEAQSAARQAESGDQQQRRQLDAYEVWLREHLETLKAALPPERLQTLRQQAREQVRQGERMPSYVLARRVEHEVEAQLIQGHGLPSFEVWSEQYQTATLSLNTQDGLPP